MLRRAVASYAPHRMWRNFATIGNAEDLIITNACVKQLKQLRSKPNNEDVNLRIGVDAGGCSGFQYTFDLDKESVTDDDIVFEKGGVKVIVDDVSAEFIKGATVDYEQEMIRSAFAIVNNPLSETACGCGSSFAVKAFTENPAVD